MCQISLLYLYEIIILNYCKLADYNGNHDVRLYLPLSDTNDRFVRRLETNCYIPD